MSNLRERLHVEAAMFEPDLEPALGGVLRRGRRRRLVSITTRATGALAFAVLAAVGVAAIAERTQEVRPADDPMGFRGRCAPASKVAAASGADRLVAGETLTRLAWLEHGKKQAGPSGPYTGFDPADPALQELMTVCVYDGDFGVISTKTQAPPGGEARDTRMSFIIARDGTVSVDSIGQGDRLLPPAAWEAARHGRPLPPPSP
jgi:hypothetical protein